MLPQLFINYKLKSVAALPWRSFMYKAFNTFIDDVFAFIITMPTAHRLACFRDDIVFLIYLVRTTSTIYTRNGLHFCLFVSLFSISDGFTPSISRGSMMAPRPFWWKMNRRKKLRRTNKNDSTGNILFFSVRIRKHAQLHILILHFTTFYHQTIWVKKYNK